MHVDVETSELPRITWWPDAAVDAETLVRLVVEVTGPIDGLSVVHACRSCGSDRHGKTHVVVPHGPVPAFVSLGRSDGLTVVAVTDEAPVGVDVERVRADSPADLRAWVRAESLVKATGHGLIIDPATIDAPRRTIDLAAPDGFVAAVTILG